MSVSYAVFSPVNLHLYNMLNATDLQHSDTVEIPVPGSVIKNNESGSYVYPTELKLVNIRDLSPFMEKLA